MPDSTKYEVSDPQSSSFIKSIEVTGFQSLYNIRIDLGKFTVIHGESDVGKSAFFRAFRSVLDAESGDSFISHDEKKVSVTLNLSDGRSISWIKQRAKSSSYKLDETIWRNVSSVPKDILKVLRLTEIVVNGERIFPSMQGQFDPIFMLSESSSKRAKILGSIISNILLNGVREANLEKTRNDSDVRGLETTIQQLEKEKDVDWSKFDERIILCKSLLSRKKKLAEYYSDLRDKRASLEYLNSCILKTDSFVSAFSGLPNIFYRASTFFSFLEIILEKLKRYNNILKLTEVKKFEFDSSIISRLGKLIDFSAEVNNLLSRWNKVSRDLDLSSREFDSVNFQMTEAKKKMDEAEKNIVMTCPFCLKKIPLGLMR